MLELTRSRFIRYFGSSLAATTILAACGGGPQPTVEAPAPAPAEVQEEAFDDADFTLMVGIANDNPPFASEENGETVGFEADLMRLVGDDSGYIIELKPLPAVELLTAVEAGEIVAAIGTLPITTENLAVVDFTRPYYEASEDEYYAIAVTKGDAGNLDVIDAGLSSVLRSREYSASYQQWFNEEAPESLPTSYVPGQ